MIKKIIYTIFWPGVIFKKVLLYSTYVQYTCVGRGAGWGREENGYLVITYVTDMIVFILPKYGSSQSVDASANQKRAVVAVANQKRAMVAPANQKRAVVAPANQKRAVHKLLQPTRTEQWMLQPIRREQKQLRTKQKLLQPIRIRTSIGCSSQYSRSIIIVE